MLYHSPQTRLHIDWPHCMGFQNSKVIFPCQSCKKSGAFDQIFGINPHQPRYRNCVSIIAIVTVPHLCVRKLIVATLYVLVTYKRYAWKNTRNQHQSLQLSLQLIDMPTASLFSFSFEFTCDLIITVYMSILILWTFCKCNMIY